MNEYMNLKKQLKENSMQVAAWPKYIRAKDLESFTDNELEGAIAILLEMIEERKAIIRRRRTYRNLGFADL